MTMPEETATPVAATATPENVRDLRSPFLSAGSVGVLRCFGTYFSCGTEELANGRLQGVFGKLDGSP
jgi:hypothetical protein